MEVPQRSLGAAGARQGQADIQDYPQNIRSRDCLCPSSPPVETKALDLHLHLPPDLLDEHEHEHDHIISDPESGSIESHRVPASLLGALHPIRSDPITWSIALRRRSISTAVNERTPPAPPELGGPMFWLVAMETTELLASERASAACIAMSCDQFLPGSDWVGETFISGLSADALHCSMSVIWLKISWIHLACLCCG